ncbi:hypothetical protein COOONC_07650 [Cooperia oncophora]
MKKAPCRLCGRSSYVKDMRIIGTNAKSRHFILIATLSLIGVVETAHVVGLVDHISKKYRCLCHSHVIQAGQYLCGEITASGKCISFYNDPYAQRSTAYVSTGDIPPHLVDIINEIGNGDVTITAKDLMTFVNAALKRYYGTSVWPQQYEQMGMEEVDFNTENGECTTYFESHIPMEGSSAKVAEIKEADEDGWKTERNHDVKYER